MTMNQLTGYFGDMPLSKKDIQSLTNAQFQGGKESKSYVGK